MRAVERNDSRFTAIFIPDEGLTYSEGMPVLPMVSRFVIVPPTAGIELIVNAGDPIRIEANYPPVYCDDDELYPNARRVDLQQSGLYPDKIAEMSDPTIIRGVRLVKITTYPVQYDARNNLFLHYENIQTELRFTDAEPVNPVLKPDRRHRSREFMKLIDALAINSDVLNRDDAESLSPYAGHYLVAAHENCVNPARPFIEWRRKAGYKMEDDVYSPRTVCVEFPVHEPHFKKGKRDVSMWEQLEIAAQYLHQNQDRHNRWQPLWHHDRGHPDPFSRS